MENSVKARQGFFVTPKTLHHSANTMQFGLLNPNEVPPDVRATSVGLQKSHGSDHTDGLVEEAPHKSSAPLLGSSSETKEALSFDSESEHVLQVQCTLRGPSLPAAAPEVLRNREPESINESPPHQP